MRQIPLPPIVAVLLVLLAFSPTAQADRPELPLETLRKSPHIIVGTVWTITSYDAQYYAATSSPYRSKGDVDRHYRYTIRVTEVEKSSGGIEVGDLIHIDAWELRSRVGGLFATLTYWGHRVLPKTMGDTVRLYLNGLQRTTYAPVEPNGFELINSKGPAEGGSLSHKTVRSSAVRSSFVRHFGLFIAGIGAGAFLTRRKKPRSVKIGNR